MIEKSEKISTVVGSELLSQITDIIPDHKVSEAMDLQSVEERNRRKEVLAAEAMKQAAILRSEGEKLRLQNESEGEKIKTVNLAEAEKQKQIREAEGAAEAVKLQAQARSEALEMIASVIEKETKGMEAMQLELALNYYKTMANALEKGNQSTVFLPQNVGDVNSAIAQAVSVFKNVK